MAKNETPSSRAAVGDPFLVFVPLAISHPASLEVWFCRLGEADLPPRPRASLALLAVIDGLVGALFLLVGHAVRVDGSAVLAHIVGFLILRVHGVCSFRFGLTARRLAAVLTDVEAAQERKTSEK